MPPDSLSRDARPLDRRPDDLLQENVGPHRNLSVVSNRGKEKIVGTAVQGDLLPCREFTCYRRMQRNRFCACRRLRLANLAMNTGPFDLDLQGFEVNVLPSEGNQLRPAQTGCTGQQ